MAIGESFEFIFSMSFLEFFIVFIGSRRYKSYMSINCKDRL